MEGGVTRRTGSRGTTADFCSVLASKHSTGSIGRVRGSGTYHEGE
jgi:hypothetical protein